MQHEATLNLFLLFRLEAERLAAECNMRLYRTSVKEDLNVGSVFQHLAENYVNKVTSHNYIYRQQSPSHSLLAGTVAGSIQTGKRKDAPIVVVTLYRRVLRILCKWTVSLTKVSLFNSIWAIHSQIFISYNQQSIKFQIVTHLVTFVVPSVTS